MAKFKRCNPDFPHHIWERRGLDVVRGKLVRVRRCELCGNERYEKYTKATQRAS